MAKRGSTRRRRKDLYYVMPGSKGGARKARLRNWTLTIFLGTLFSSLIGWLLHTKDCL